MEVTFACEAAPTHLFPELARRIGGGMERFFLWQTTEEYLEEYFKPVPGGFAYMRQHGVWLDPKKAPNYRPYERHLTAAELEGSTTDTTTGIIYKGEDPATKQHVSLLLSETLQVDPLARDLERLGDLLQRLAVRFSHVGVFTEPELGLFYGLTPTARLLRLHADVAGIYRRWSSDVTARTQPGVWAPHGTLATGVDPSRLSEAIAAASTLTLPWAVPQLRLAIVRFDQECVELLHVLPWQGAPPRRRASPVRRVRGAWHPSSRDHMDERSP
ncbi:MAG TPA: 2'-5' RNA ligase family protein [Alphaproteobacteria bacterium]|nr:2'-5' RNA ligase family protein [Alphaproteobacteria bacterium]